MGEGVIVSGGTKGQYLVTVDYGSEIKADLLAIKNARKAVLEPHIATLESTVTTFQAEYDAYQSQLNTAIDDYNVDTGDPALKAELEAATLLPLRAKRDLRKATTGLGRLKLELTNINEDIAQLNAVNPLENKTIWCTDYTENASGNVALYEINAEQPTFVIAPGGAKPAGIYGRMIARELQRGYQAYYNDAILPGVQKYKPTFRSGVMVAIDYDNDLCTVKMDAARSSAQELDINISDQLSDIPIEYMTCNAFAFELGDKVVVQFVHQNPNEPKVIGFVTNPRLCNAEEVWFLVEVGSRVVDPAVPRGDKAHASWVNGVFTDPAPGNRIYTGRTYTTEYCDPSTQWDPASYEGYFDTLRIRFDVAWIKSFSTNTLFETYPAIDVTTHGDHYDMAPSGLPPGGGVLGAPLAGGFGGSQNIGAVYIKCIPRWIDATASNLLYWISQWELNGGYTVQHHLSEDTVPAWTGGTPQTEFYGFQGWSGQNYEKNVNLIANDLDHANNWLLQFYTPPATITLDVLGVPTDYSFVRLGGSPRSEDVLQTVPVATPASFGHAISYQTNGEFELAALYRLAPP